MARILVIDDQQDTLDLLVRVFEKEGYVVDAAADGAGARELLESSEYDVVFTDLRLGYPFDGLEMLEFAKHTCPRTQVIIMTAFSSVESSVLAMKAGAYDYITKPFTAEEVQLLAARATEKATLTDQVRLGATGTDIDPVLATEIVGRSPALMRVMRVVGQVARTDATVLISGESGTGKELVARAIHQLSPRVDRPFVAVNCGAIPENLQESEFFGHVRGAFTGAIRTKIGLFEQADKGTLFLDEVGETSLSSQVKLLRFLQLGEVRKVGDTRSARLDVRLVAATNRNLEEMIAEKSFREDLYYRLNIIAVEVPPLRDREGDVEILARYFLAKKSRKLGNGVVGFLPEAMHKLVAHSWPGNVRELENAIERAVTLTRGQRVAVEDLPVMNPGPSRARSEVYSPNTYGDRALTRAPTQPLAPRRSQFQAQTSGGAPRRSQFQAQTSGGVAAGGIHASDPAVVEFPSLATVEQQHIEVALAHFGGNRTRTSVALGISKATLWRKLKAYAKRAEGEVVTHEGETISTEPAR
jgi:DNA-binding NtrC family response regulator